MAIRLFLRPSVQAYHSTIVIPRSAATRNLLFTSLKKQISRSARNDKVERMTKWKEE
jgi:hypothetical protein